MRFELFKFRIFRNSDKAIDINGLLLNGQTYWLDKYGHYKTGFYHGVHYYFQGWLKESVARTIIDSPEMSAVIGEFVERMID